MNDQFLDAVSTGDLDAVLNSINGGANVNVLGGQALLDASRLGYLEIVRVLLERGARFHFSEHAPLMEAAKMGHLEIVRLLLDWDPNKVSHPVAIRWAVDAGHLGVVKLLLERGAKIGDWVEDYIHWGSSENHPRIILTILEMGPSVMSTSRRDTDPQLELLDYRRGGSIPKYLKRFLGIKQLPKIREELIDMLKVANIHIE